MGEMFSGSAGLARQLDLAVMELDSASGELVQGVFGLDGSRSHCGALAGHYADFARRTASTYPSLAGPAGRLGGLFLELDAALGRLSATTEELVASADRLIAQVGDSRG